MTRKFKILVIAPSWVGDMVMAQTLFKTLYLNYKGQIEIDVFANSWALDILKRMPEVNNIILNPFGHGEFKLFSRIKLGLSLKKNNYDQAFILPNSFKSALIPFFAFIQKRTGFIGEGRFLLINDIYKLNPKTLPLMVDRFCALANRGKKPELIPFPTLEVKLANQKILQQKFELSTNKKIIALCPGAEYGEAKRWPIEYFSELADSLITKNYQIIILGSNKDSNIANDIIGKSKFSSSIINLCGSTTLSDVVDLISLSEITITNDSGLMHIAASCNTKVLAIYGSTSANFTPPLTQCAQIVKVDLDCSPCFERQCKFGHYNCLKLITPKIVLQKLTSWL